MRADAFGTIHIPQCSLATMVRQTGKRRRQPSLSWCSGTAAVTLLHLQFARNNINEIHLASAWVTTVTRFTSTDTHAWQESAHPLIISVAALPVRVAETGSCASASVFESWVEARRNVFPLRCEEPGSSSPAQSRAHAS